MSYSEAYTRIEWHDAPATDTALEAENINHMDSGIKTNDIRIAEIGNNAMYSADVANCLCGQPELDPETGIFTFPTKSGGSYTLDTMLEKVIVNFNYDEDTGELVIYLEDGTEKRVSLSRFITETEFDDTSTIDFTVANHHVSADVKAHSIGDDQMVVSYRVDCQSAKADAESAADASETSALESEGYAVGKQNGVDVPSTSPYYHNNAKYYSEQASGQFLSGLHDVSLTNPADGESLIYDANNQMWVNGDASIDIIDNLTSTRTDAALSANMGRAMNEDIESFVADLFYGIVTVHLATENGEYIACENDDLLMAEKIIA